MAERSHERAMLCPYNCGPHQIKEGLDGSWSCPRCCRPAPLWIVAHAAYERGVTEGAVRCASLQEEAVKQRLAAQNARGEVKQLRAELAELRSQANEYGRHPAPTVASAELEADLRAKAVAAYEAMMKELMGRCGIENAFDDIDGAIRDEIAEACVTRIEAALGLGSGK
jgi:hypothetical protein